MRAGKNGSQTHTKIRAHESATEEGKGAVGELYALRPLARKGGNKEREDKETFFSPLVLTTGTEKTSS